MRPFAAQAILAYFAISAASAQSDALSFDVASVKISDSLTDAMGGTIGFRPGGSMSVRNITLQHLIYLAFGVEDYRVSGGPGWISVLRYDVDAKPAARVDASEARLMLQTLLAERFKLQLHRENRTVDGYALTAPKGESKLQKLDSDAEVGFRIMSMKEMRGSGDMAMLARNLKAVLGVPVEDSTGLKGKYEIALHYSLDDAAADGQPAIFAALNEQLGLALKRGKVPIEVLVIDHAEKPAAN